MEITPSLFLKLFLFAQSMYAITLMPLIPGVDGCEMYWGSECTDTVEKWILNWFGLGIILFVVPFFTVILQGEPSDELLRRCSVYVIYCLFTQLAGLLFSGHQDMNPKGLLVPGQLYFAIFVNFVLLQLGGMVIGNGKLKAATNIWAPEDPPSQALLLQIIALNFWVYDAGFISGVSKYLKDPHEISERTNIASKWFILTLIANLCFSIFVASYETTAKKKKFCAVMIAMHVLVQVFETYLNQPELVPDEMKIQNMSLRVVLIGGAAYGFMA